MVQPVVRNIPQQRLQTVLHSTKNILFRIISFLRYALYVINFLRAIPSYCASAREFMRKCTTPENKRAYKYLLGMAMQEPDLAIIFWASVTSQLYTVFMDCCAAVYHHSKFLVKYKALSPVFFWVEKRLFAAFRALTRYSLWESRARPVDLVAFWHDYKIRIIRRVKRRNWNALQILLYALHPATIYKTTCRFFGILAVWRWTSLDYLFHGRPPSNFGRDINLINGFVRVRLGLPTYNRIEPDDPWGLDREYTLLSDFRLKSDGSLDLRRVKEHWNLSAVLVLDPGRYECFEPADENYLSHFAIGVLSMRDGFITIVDKPDWFTKKRTRLRQYLLSSRVYYLIRVSIPFFVSSLIIYSTYCSYVCFCEGSAEEFYKGLCVVLALTLVFTLLYVSGYEWAKIPQRYTRSFIDPKGSLFSAWMRT